MSTLIKILLFSFCLICSCAKKEVAPIIYGGSGVYVAGETTSAKTGNSIATYWKNGVAVMLTNGVSNAAANSIFVSGLDVYVTGYENDKNHAPLARLWKNGIVVTPTNAVDISSVFVSGSDVYVAGRVYNENGLAAVYWKNGVMVPLSDGTKYEYVTSIVVSGSDVFVTGQENDFPVYGSNLNSVPIAKYWKNGVPFNLTDGTHDATARSIAVSGSDVYVAGWESSTLPLTNEISIAKYWKNGVAVSLTDGTASAFATSIAVAGSDIYVAGYEFLENMYITEAKYWKNGTAVMLTNGQMFSTEAVSIGISGPDVYVAGFGNGLAEYWKNGTQDVLNDQTNYSGAVSIFIVP